MKFKPGDCIILKSLPFGFSEEWNNYINNKFIIDNVVNYGVLAHSIKPLKLSHTENDCTRINSLIFSHTKINDCFEKYIESYWPEWL